MPIRKIIFCSFMRKDQSAKVDHYAFSSVSDSRNLSLLCHFGGDSTLVPWIAYARD